MTGPPPPTRRRSSVTFQLADVQALQQQPLRMSPTLINNSAAAAAARGTPGAGEGGEGIGVRARRALPLPLLVFGVGMVAMGGWIWAAPAFVYAGFELYKGQKRHKRGLSASGRARRASSGNVAELVGRIRGRTLSTKICVICLDSIPDDEPFSDLFDCKHDAQTHKACIDKWLEKHETCPLCRRDVKDPVVEEMKKQPLNPEAQLKGCRFIVLKGWQNEMYQRHFVEVGAAELVANALKAHGENRELVAACCAAIFVLAFASKETQNRLVGMGVCEMIVKAMSQYLDDMEVQSRGCGAIYSLSLSNKETQRQLCESKAPAAVLNSLHKYMSDTSVAISAADAIMSLACDNRFGQDLLGSGEGALPELQGKGACELLGELVDRYATERDVMYAGLDAVMKLAIDNPENRLRFGEGGMCEKVMMSFARYQDDEMFLLVAFTAVYTMAENQRENQARLLEDEGAQVLVGTLQRHEGFQDIVSVGLDVLFSLTYDAAQGPNTASHPALREAGSCEFILKMLQNYPQCPEIYGPGMKALACMLVSPENQLVMTGPAWCQVVCDSMMHALELRDVPVLEICCRVVGNMALHSAGNQAALAEGGACQMVCECLRKGYSKWEATEAAADLAYNCPDNRQALGIHDAVALVVRCIEKNMEDPVALDIAFMALTNLVQDNASNAQSLHAQRIRLPRTRLGGSGSGSSEKKVSIYELLTTMLADVNLKGERACINMMALSIFCGCNNVQGQTQIGDAGACEAVVKKLRQEQAEGATIRQGVQLMSDLATCHLGNQNRLREAGGIELLLQFLPEFKKDALDSARWLLTASMLAENNPANQQLLFSLGVVETAMELLQVYPEEDTLLDSALGCLASIANNNRKHQDHIGALGACELVCKVAEKSIHNEHFLTRVCSVVLTLSELEKADESGQAMHIWKDNSFSNKNRLREAGAVAIFSKAIQVHAELDADPFLLGGLILSLALIAEDDVPTNTYLRETGIYELLMQLIQKHPDHDTLLTAAGGFIATCSVVFNDDWSEWSKFESPVAETQEIFIRGGAVPYILKAMARFPDDKGTIIMGFISLAALAWQNKEGIALVVESIETIDKALANDVNKGPDGMFYGLLALGALVSFPENDPKVVATCRPVIERWEKKAWEMYPENNCLRKMRGLLLAHVAGEEQPGGGAMIRET